MSGFRNKAMEKKKANRKGGELNYEDFAICLNAKLNGMKGYLVDSGGYEQVFMDFYRRAILTAIAKNDRKYFELAQKARESYEQIASIKIDCVEKMGRVSNLEEIAQNQIESKEFIPEYIPKPSGNDN